jgi:hypothetical protein
MVWLATLAISFIVPAHGLSAEEPKPDPIDYYRAKYEAARDHYRERTNDLAASWRLAQATFDLADNVAESARREELALEGVRVCRRVLETHTNSAPAHHFLAMNLGQVARSRPLSALKIVRQMETAFLQAAALDPAFDHAGPDRSLGLLYRDAPGWPASIGSRNKARHHLARAVDLEPDYPENRLTLAESGVQWKDFALVDRQVGALRKDLPKAREILTGPSWGIEWVGWDRRWKALLEDHAKLRKRAAGF